MYYICTLLENMIASGCVIGALMPMPMSKPGLVTCNSVQQMALSITRLYKSEIYRFLQCSVSVWSGIFIQIVNKYLTIEQQATANQLFCNRNVSERLTGRQTNQRAEIMVELYTQPSLIRALRDQRVSITHKCL
jgi:hypothetical protein